MISSVVKSIEFPSPETKVKIAELPKFTADVSMFIEMTPEEIAEWVLEQDSGAVVINASNMQGFERARFEAANEILVSQGKEIQLIDEKEKVAVVTREITREMVDLNVIRRAFKSFVFDVLKNDSESFVAGYNTYFADPERANTYDTAHYWENIGLADPSDRLRERVNELFEVVMSLDMQDGSGRTFFDVFEEKVSPRLNEVPGVDSVRDQCRADLLEMFSNMNRGPFYNESDTKKVYGMRKRAVDEIQSAILAETFAEVEDEVPKGSTTEMMLSDVGLDESDTSES
ncbi:hypothetical protein HOG17_01635 [Candidatus Peregrinibacteria bacterium]|nr:hypothetical protein [Candidatus Peregrinibacteria bacterium]MBT4366137.1 hypothetical protein [Candidatus Peregrinibacteria bacterium]MBT4456586.1 hypothetical protein [Candidatus Peregrinibacteria bacterium]